MVQYGSIPTEHADRSYEEQLQVLALALFDNTAALHQLPAAARRLLQLAAACYAAARQAGAEHPDQVGRDAALAAPIDDLTPEQQCIVASVVAFQREQLHRSRELAYLRLDERDQQTTLRLTALLSLATILTADPRGDLLVWADKRHLRLVVAGPDGGQLSASLAAWAEHWRDTFGHLTIQQSWPDHVPAGDAPLLLMEAAARISSAPIATTMSLSIPGRLAGHESLAEGARRMLRQRFERLLAREAAVRDGEDPEDVHQMRVATRRLRASLQVVQPIYDARAIRAFRKGLQQVAAALGAVRDRDVFLAYVLAFTATLAEHDRTILDQLVAAVERERAEARKALLADLDAHRYTTFKHAFARFLTTPGARVCERPATGTPTRVRDSAGSLIWRRYEEWRAFEVVVPGGHDDLLHQARIAGKRLRYTIEFFAEALGPATDQLLAPLAVVQDKLGDLQDSVVARAYIRRLGLEADPGAQAYLAARDAERVTLLAELPGRWDQVASPAYRRQLLDLIAQL